MAAAQGAAGSGLRLTPTMTAEQTVLEYRARRGIENGLESVTRLSPGLAVTAGGPLLRGRLVYSADMLFRSGLEATAGREIRNTLDASLVAEPVRGRAFVEARAAISEQAVSALGRPVGTGLQVNSNRTEVRTLSVSPTLRGAVAPNVDFEANVTGGLTDAGANTSDTIDSRFVSGRVSLASRPGARLLGWNVWSEGRRTDFRGAARASTTARVNAALVAQPDVDWRLSVSGGRERTDVGFIERRDFDTYGAAVQWTPSPRTTASLTAEERFFGRAYRGAFQYRTPRTVWSYSAVRDVTTGAEGLTTGQPQTLLELLLAQFASIEADPARREALVLDFLRQIGRDPTERLAGGALASGISVQQRHEIGAVWLGRRLTVSLQAFRTSSRQIDAGGPVSDDRDFSQRGYSTVLSYRLTPQVSTSLGGSRALSDTARDSVGTDLKSAFASLTAELGRHTTGTVQARYSVFNSLTDPYRETLVAAAISLRF